MNLHDVSKFAALVVTLAATMLVPCAAHGGGAIVAETHAPDADAQQHFQRGVDLFADGDFESALFEFETSFASSGNAHLLYNIAVCQYELHRYAAATLAYRKYLDELEDDLDAERVRKVRERLQTLDLRVGRVVVQSNPPGAVVRSGGEVVGVTPAEITLDLGERSIELEKDGYEVARESVRVIGGKKTSVDVELQETPDASLPPAAVVSPKPAPATDNTPRRGYRGLRTGSLIALGIAGGATVGAVITGSLALRANNDITDERERETSRQTLRDLNDRRDNLALTTDVLIGVASAAAVVSLALGVTYLVRRRSKREGSAKARLRVDPASLAVRF